MTLMWSATSVLPTMAAKDPGVTGPLTPGQFATIGQWSEEMCTSPGVPVPVNTLTDRRTIDVAEPSLAVLTLQLAPSFEETGRAASLTVRFERAGIDGVPWKTEALKDSQGKDVTLRLKAPARPAASASLEPITATASLPLDRGSFRTLAKFRYCSGLFTLTLDSLTPLSSPKATKGKVRVKSIKPASKSVTMAKGERRTLSVRVVPEAAQGAKLTWTSSNARVATVAKSGLVKARKVGRTTIRVRGPSGKAATIRVTVTPRRP